MTGEEQASLLEGSRVAMSRPLRYVRFFVERKRTLSLFGERLIVYTAVLLAACLVMALRGGNVNSSPVVPVAVNAFVFIVSLMHFVSLPALLSARLSVAHDEYLRYLGFTDRQLRSLARMIAVPANLACALFVFVSLTEGVSWGLRLGLSVVTFALGELMCPCLFRLRKRRGLRVRTARQSPVKRSTLARAYDGPYRAFFQKDICELRRPAVVANAVLIVLVAFGLMLLARLISYGICFYLALLIVTETLVSTLFENEEKACRDYYPRQLRLRDGQIVAYKLPLQILVVACMAFALVVFDGLLNGFAVGYLFLALGITAYCVVLCAALGWWYARQLKKADDFSMVWMPIFLFIAAIPGTALLYVAATCLTKRWRTAKDVRHA